MSTLVISKDIGGQILGADSIENYPGFDTISGFELAQKMMKKAVKFGTEILEDEVVRVEEDGKEGKYPIYGVKTRNKKEFKAKTLILAFGKTPRNLDAPGEIEYKSKGVSYCATCDMPLFTNKIVAVVGGGNSAFDSALFGSKIAKKVYLIHRREGFRAFEGIIEDAKKTPNIEFLLNTIITKVIGKNGRVSGIKIKNVKTNEEKEIALDGIFVEIGSETQTDMVKHLVKLNSNNQVIVNRMQETFYPKSNKVRPGIFAAGDLTDTTVKQIVVATGEGCKAALQAHDYIYGLSSKIIADWGAKI